MRARTWIVCVALLGCSTKEPGKKEPTSTTDKPTTTKPAASETPGAATTSAAPAEGDIPAPPDVSAPPPDAEKTASGLAFKVLSPGTGKEHPEPQDTVTVHYSGWTTDGKMFDSSLKRGTPATFPLTAVIKGWTEGVGLMVEGEKRRFWIPVELAYNHKPGRPDGMLVFDIELISIKKGPKPLPAPPDVASAPADAKKTPSGLAWKLLSAPTNKTKATAQSLVRIHYTGWSTDGKMLDSSVVRGEPVSFKVETAPDGFKEILSDMAVGEKRRVWMPKKLAFRGGNGPETPGDIITFEIELVNVLDLTAPADVKAPPADAEKTKSGLASKVLTKGTGTEHPTKDSVVKVNYTGWTTDGKMFDSSVPRGRPAEFPLGGVIPGWTEGVQLMVAGEKRRFWIPEELAYKGKPDGPQGMLVFDIELLEIKKQDQ